MISTPILKDCYDSHRFNDEIGIVFCSIWIQAVHTLRQVWLRAHEVWIRHDEGSTSLTAAQVISAADAASCLPLLAREHAEALILRILFRCCKSRFRQPKPVPLDAHVFPWAYVAEFDRSTQICGDCCKRVDYDLRARATKKECNSHATIRLFVVTKGGKRLPSPALDLVAVVTLPEGECILALVRDKGSNHFGRRSLASVHLVLSFWCIILAIQEAKHVTRRRGWQGVQADAQVLERLGERVHRLQQIDLESEQDFTHGLLHEQCHAVRVEEGVDEGIGYGGCYGCEG